MTTETSTATRVKATRVRQAERIIKDFGEPAVRVGLVNTNASDSQTKNTRLET